jgi:hypothetical protein
VTVNPGGFLTLGGAVGDVTSNGGIFEARYYNNLDGRSGNLTLNSTSTFYAALNGFAPGADYDQVAVHGSVNLGGASLLISVNNFYPSVNNQFIVIQNDLNEPVTGTFNGLPEGGTFVQNGITFQISYQGGTGNDVVLTVIKVPYP